jgi:hypothetical protein
VREATPKEELVVPPQRVKATLVVAQRLLIEEAAVAVQVQQAQLATQAETVVMVLRTVSQELL